MKAVILAGGLGTRLSEETRVRPKPMVEVGGRPLLWHIMQQYAAHDVTDFVVCLGYKGYVIKEFFVNYFLHRSDITIDLAKNEIEVHETASEPWRVTLVDTGQDTMTGGRLKRVSKFVENEDTFCMTYGDGVSDIDIAKLISWHKAHGLKATVTAVQPPGRFGALSIEDDLVRSFKEKPVGDGSWINGGFFVLSPEVLPLIEGDHTVWERGPMEKLAAQGQLAAFRHDGFWQPVDTLRDKRQLDDLWEKGKAPWRVAT